ncbi:MAG TPA: glycosyltransferase family 87 protein [Candidatus Dormibacteraeota bacterium]|nr:glycosyltransferase family 87 protein [Candidatus Dormibacteraeota bacterium]
MTSASRRWENLGIAAGAAAAVLFAAFDLYQWAAAYAADHFHNDFTFYLAAARIGLVHGWPSIYDLHLQQAELNAMGSGITVAELARYISPPPVAWLALPLTPLPYPVAYWTWSALLVAALCATWFWAAPVAGRARVIYLLAAVGWLPVIYGLQLGQPGLLVAAGVAVSYALLRAGHQWWAGIALGAMVFKPQLAFLLPLALVAAGQYRAFAASAIALGALALVSVIALGPGGVSAYVDRLSFASNVPVNQALTLGFRPAQILIAAWTMLVIYRLRGRGIEWTYACALVGGMLATPYVHLDDLAMLGLAGCFVLRADAPRWNWIYVLAGVIAVEGEPFWGPWPVIVAELGALALLSAAALRSRADLTLPQIDARPLELRPKQ